MVIHITFDLSSAIHYFGKSMFSTAMYFITWLLTPPRGVVS
jgi:hypothetical protein